jgi:pyocin large subunit-like protein
MEWDSRRQAYTFTTEENPGITLIWTPDRTGESKPWDTGNHNPVRIPNPVVVDPLPEDTGIGATTSPTPEEDVCGLYSDSAGGRSAADLCLSQWETSQWIT